MVRLIKIILASSVFLALGQSSANESLKRALTKIVKPKEKLEVVTIEKGPFSSKFRPYRQWKRNINETIEALKIVKNPLIKFEGKEIKKIKVEHFQDFNEYYYRRTKKEQGFLLIGGSVLETAYLTEKNPKNRRNILKKIIREKKKLPFTKPLHKFFGTNEIHYFQTIGKFICDGKLIGRNRTEIANMVQSLKKDIIDKNITIKMQQKSDLNRFYWRDQNDKSDIFAFRIDFPDKRYLQAQFSIPRGQILIYRPIIRYFDRVKDTYFKIPNVYMKSAIELTVDCNLNFGWRGYLHAKKVINPFKALKKFIVFDKDAKVIKTITSEEPRKTLEAIYTKSELKELDKIRPKFLKNFVKVAVIDTGIDYNHPVLAHKMLETTDLYSPTEVADKKRKLRQAFAANKFLSGILRKKGLSPETRKMLEQRKKRITELQLGLQTDLSFGWNGFFKNSIPFDGSDLMLNGMNYQRLGSESIGHGTHVAGIAGKGNAIKIIPIKAHLGRFKQKEIKFERLTKSLEDAARVIKSKKPDIVNMSMGGYYKTPWFPMLKTMNENPGTLFFYSAGNAGNYIIPDPYPNELGKKNESTHRDKGKLKWPPSFNAINQIVVGSVNGLPGNVDKVTFSRFSEYGNKVVDIAAPGEDIISVRAGGGEKEMTGTSQASPFMANVAAKMLLVNPKLKPVDIKRILFNTGTRFNFLKDKVRCGCVVNPDLAIKRAAEAAQ